METAIPAFILFVKVFSVVATILLLVVILTAFACALYNDRNSNE